MQHVTSNTNSIIPLRYFFEQITDKTVSNNSLFQIVFYTDVKEKMTLLTCKK